MIWPFSKAAGQGLTGVALEPGAGGAAVAVERRAGRLVMQHWARCVAADDDGWPVEDLLAQRRGPIVAVMEAGQYQSILVERPDVPDAEVAAAVRWRIRDLVDFAVDAAVVDVFDVPTQARGNRRMVYAVAAPNAAVTALQARLGARAAGLSAIDIPELCVRNLAAVLPQDQSGVACLLIRGGRGLLTLTRNGQLYLVRQMEIGESAVSQPGAIGQIALELQRSLDYFESHYDQRPIRDVVIAPAIDAGAYARALSEEMAVEVSLLDLNEIVDAARELTAEEQADCVLALGAALRGPDVLEQAA